MYHTQDLAVVRRLRLFMCVYDLTWLVHVCHDSSTCIMTHSCVMWLAPCAAWDIHVCNMTYSCVLGRTHVCHDSFMCDVTCALRCLMHSCVYTVCHDSSMCVSWLVHVCRDLCMLTCLIMWHDSFTCDMTDSCATGLIHMCDRAHSFIRQNAFISVTKLMNCALGRAARPYESCKIFKGRPRRNAFSKLVHSRYKSFPPDRFCQVEIQNTTGLSNKSSNA